MLQYDELSGSNPRRVTTRTHGVQTHLDPAINSYGVSSIESYSSSNAALPEPGTGPLAATESDSSHDNAVGASEVDQKSLRLVSEVNRLRAHLLEVNHSWKGRQLQLVGTFFLTPDGI
ncbi:unnamed protein product [Protopolystoma xenopodis]|uniref:Uncharacterized protein n=1 Tax=Protopolystoma xenopodis TaxID=117903 RepID=A0A448X506_9PLAT|nr:unnamed protein product [Protopolystoma xenopodis]